MTERGELLLTAIDRQFDIKLDEWQRSPLLLKSESLNSLFDLASQAGVDVRIELSKKVLDYTGKVFMYGIPVSGMSENLLKEWGSQQENSVFINVPFSSKDHLFKVLSGTTLHLLKKRSVGWDGIANFLPSDVKSIQVVK